MSTSTGPTLQPLTPRQMAVLEFERHWWKYQGAKDTAVRIWFGLDPTRYAQLKNQIIDLPAAEVYDPENVRRMRRIRDRQQQARGARSLGFDLAAEGGAR